MNEQLRQSLLAACALAGEFIKSADSELRGASPERRREAAMQLRAALANIDVTGKPEVPHLCGIDREYLREMGVEA